MWVWLCCSRRCTLHVKQSSRQPSASWSPAQMPSPQPHGALQSLGQLSGRGASSDRIFFFGAKTRNFCFVGLLDAVFVAGFGFALVVAAKTFFGAFAHRHVIGITLDGRNNDDEKKKKKNRSNQPSSLGLLTSTPEKYNPTLPTLLNSPLRLYSSTNWLPLQLTGSIWSTVCTVGSLRQ